METGGSDTEDLLLLKLGGRLLASNGLSILCEEILSAAIDATHADGGSLEVFDGDADIARWRTCRDRSAASSFPSLVDPRYTSSVQHRAMLEQGRRIVVPDLLQSCEILDESQRTALMEVGAASLVATPIRSRSGKLLGIVTVCWSRPTQPLDCALHCMDVLARQGAGMFERMQPDATVAASEARLRLLVDAGIEQPFDSLMEVVRAAVRQLSQPDGVSVVLRDGGQFHYFEDKAIRTRWPGQRFPLLAHCAERVMRDGSAAVVSDVGADERIPAGRREPDFIRSLLLVPVGLPEPTAVIAAYWSYRHDPDPREIAILQALARATGMALHNIELLASLRRELAERRRAEAALRDSEERLRRALQAGEVFAYEWNCGDDIMIRSANCTEILGADCRPIDTTGRAWESHVHPDDRERFREAIAGLEHGGVRSAVTYRHVRRDGSVVWLQENSVGERGSDGRLLRVSGLVRDVTARKRVEELQQLLIREFDHRARNMLATIQAMISLTARTQTDVGEFVAAVQNRIRSMARAHALIAGSQWTGASVRDIIRDELDPYVAGRPGAASVSGEDEVLTPGATMALALALHELATNAAKYGALSVAEGHVHIELTRDADGALGIEWRETGGPDVIPPRRRGFGSLLIESSIRNEVGGSAEVRYLRTGLVCAITIPDSQIVAREPKRRAGVKPDNPHENEAARRAILLVEDRGPVARETREALESFGYRVWSAYTVDEAVRVANSEPLAAAILDINLGEKDVFPVVDVLSTRNIPIAFVTGYQLLSLPPQYRHCPVLTRPLRGDSIRRMFPLHQA